MKVADLENVRKDVPARFVRSYDSELLHIREAAADMPRTYGQRRPVSVTRCNRVIVHDRIETSKVSIFVKTDVCSRCGTVQDFEEFQQKIRADLEASERRRRDKREQEEAERRALLNWNMFGADLDNAIMGDLELLVECGNFLVPFSKTSLSFLRVILRRFLAHIDRQETKSEQMIKEWYIATDLLDHLDGYGDG
ncbi:MAG: hypothetical protein GTO24_21355 [candidate division Zixibacteria bacterium]|nr:hypothetical protein [candidate division Zixibacteria bacterium]